MDSNRIIEIYDRTLEELKFGVRSPSGYIEIMRHYEEQQDYEACAGMRKALKEYGIEFNIHEND